MAGESILARMAVEIAGNTASFSKAMNTAQSQLKDFTSGVTKAGAIIAGVFAAREIAQFALEVSKLSGEADGVRKAFDKLPDSVQLMHDLKAATGGTVSELELMKRAVNASNFGIDMQALPKLLEFAAVRAQQTGQSVDYLVDSIVTGIGRKSPLILDNLGISAAALTEKMDGVSLATADVGTVAKAVGRIAEDELKKMGGLAENAATKQQQVSASWEDFKLVLGDVINNTGILQTAMEGLLKVMTLVKDAQDESRTGDFSLLGAGVKSGDDKALKDVLVKYQRLRAEVDKPFNEANLQDIIKRYELTGDQADRFLKLVREINGELEKTPVLDKPVPPVVPHKTLETLNQDLKKANELFEQTNTIEKDLLETRALDIIRIGKQIEAIEKLRKAREQEQRMQTKFGRDTINKGPDAVGINGVDPNDLLLGLEMPKGLKDMFPSEAIVTDADLIIKKVTEVDGIFAELDQNNEIRNSRDRARHDEQVRRMEQLKQTAESLGASIGGVLGSQIGQAIVTTQEYKDKIADLTKQIANANVNDVERIRLLKEERAQYQDAIDGNKALGAAIKNVTKEIVKAMLARALSSAISTAFSSSGNPILGAALAAGASAAVYGLFNAIPDYKAGGGGHGASRVNSSTLERISYNDRPNQIVLVEGEFKMKGNDMALVLQKQYNANSRLGGPQG